MVMKGAMYMFRTCTITITIQYLAPSSEVLPNDLSSTEMAIEDGVHTILMELFGGEIIVEDVIVQEGQVQPVAA